MKLKRKSKGSKRAIVRITLDLGQFVISCTSNGSGRAWQITELIITVIVLIVLIVNDNQ